ncbi:hypothetical protein [Thiohalocapsa marina]|uniref:hypothetical protein n=1 Tax=Thiohalocapsa marina TaxID=424902 RepID=UPI0036DF8A64
MRTKSGSNEREKSLAYCTLPGLGPGFPAGTTDGVFTGPFHTVIPAGMPESSAGGAMAWSADLRAVDERGQHYNIEMQVRRFATWSASGILYLARLLSEQLEAGEGYRPGLPTSSIGERTRP